jgi:hypothetical protein
MEPTQSQIKVYVGDFEVVEVSPNTITMDLGKHVYATIHLTGVTHTIKPGDKLPFYTEITHANLGQSSIQ